MTPSIRQDGEAVSPRTSPTITPPTHDQLKTVGDSQKRTPGFRLLYEPDHELGQDSSEIAFIVEKPRSAYRYDIWTRHGSRKGVSLETFQTVYEPRSQRIRVPEPIQMSVRDAWKRGGDVSAELERLHPIMRDPAAVAGEGASR